MIVPQVATRAEELGFDSLWVTERSLLPLDPITPYPLGVLPDVYKQVLDPLEALTFVAGQTSRIISTVVPRATHNLEWLSAKYFDQTPLIAGQKGAEWGMAIDVQEPQSLGADRAVNAIAAHALHDGYVDILVVMLPLWQTGVPWGSLSRLPADPAFGLLWLVGGLCALGAAYQAKYHRLVALIFAGGAGLATVLTFAWFSAPDLALTQFGVETLFVVVFLLVNLRGVTLSSLTEDVVVVTKLAVVAAAEPGPPRNHRAAAAGREGVPAKPAFWTRATMCQFLLRMN